MTDDQPKTTTDDTNPATIPPASKAEQAADLAASTTPLPDDDYEQSETPRSGRSRSKATTRKKTKVTKAKVSKADTRKAVEESLEESEPTAEFERTEPDFDGEDDQDESGRDSKFVSQEEFDKRLASDGEDDNENDAPEGDEVEQDADADASTGAKAGGRKKTAKKTAKRTAKKSAKKTTKKVARGKTASQADASDDEAGPEQQSTEKRSRQGRYAGSSDDEYQSDFALVEDEPSEDEAPLPKLESSRMIINYVPGEECRVALMENGRLEEFHSERMDAISRVNNIYVGRVANVESGIQAAFVDFGIGESGFLHVSDLHPRYFPGAEKDDSERVGRKTPRRERPPIQQALRKGQEIVVQVLKEGVGTKGPTLTSYLSIPGRYLVMMPQMDEVGVSRKVEDEQTRREMRKILDGLDLPENFGFILRTAGLGRTKTEIKRDLAYLQRLWKDLEKRLKSGRAPRLLYSESDLLLRALRDFLTPEVEEIVIDNEQALKRASQFLKIAAPRSAVRLRSYTGSEPAFYAFGIEEQLELMHSREVPLPSGGRLVIDQTEAVVAIDVNSGRMRSAKDSESNALNTNLEAVDEICRQLRLRDLGGIVINDLIDMRPARNRKLIEQRFKDRLKRDRARTTVATISPFGILEMTRQRMRGSLHSQVFTDCPTCHGRGSVKRPSSVASDSMRHIAALLSHQRVHRAELVVGARVAGELLSKKRRTINRLERLSGKHLDVRVMEMTEPDRVVFYAYDINGADIDIDKLPTPKQPERWLAAWEDPEPDADWADMEDAEDDSDLQADDSMGIEELDPLAGERTIVDKPAPSRSQHPRQGGGRGRSASPPPPTHGRSQPQPVAKPTAKPALATSVVASAATASSSTPPPDTADQNPEAEGSGGDKKKRKRRRRRRKGDGDPATDAQSSVQSAGEASDTTDDRDDSDGVEDRNTADAGTDLREGEFENSEDKPKKKRRRRRRKRKGDGSGELNADGSPRDDQDPSNQSDHDEADSDGQSDEDDSDDQDDGRSTEGVDQNESDEENRPRSKKKRRRRRRKAGSDRGDEPRADGQSSGDAPSGDQPRQRPSSQPADRQTEPKPAPTPPQSGGQSSSTGIKPTETAAPPKPRPRSLYGSSRRKLTAAEAASVAKRKN